MTSYEIVWSNSDSSEAAWIRLGVSDVSPSGESNLLDDWAEVWADDIVIQIEQ